MNTDNFINTMEDNDLFPYECGAKDYRDMMPICFAMFKSEEFKSHIELILEHMLATGIEFSSPGGSFKRKFLVYMSQYLNFKIRFPRAGEYLKRDSKLRELLQPLAKVICSEIENIEKWKKENPNLANASDIPDYFSGKI